MNLDEAWRERFVARQEARSVAAIEAAMESAMTAAPLLQVAPDGHAAKSVPSQAAAVRGMVERLLDEKALLRQEVERLQEEQARQHNELAQVRAVLQERNRLVLDIQQEKDVLEARTRRLEAEALPFVTEKNSGYPYDLRELYETLKSEKEGFRRREERLRHKLKGERAENKLLRQALQTDVTFCQEEAEAELAKARERIRVLEKERNEATQRAMKASFVNALQKNEIDMLAARLKRPEILSELEAASPVDLPPPPPSISGALSSTMDAGSPVTSPGGARALRDDLSLARNRLEHSKHQVVRLERRSERILQRLQLAEAARGELEAELARSRISSSSDPASLVHVILAKANRFAFAEVERFRKISRKLVDHRQALLNRIEALELAKDHAAAAAQAQRADLEKQTGVLQRTIHAHERGALITKSHLVLTRASIDAADDELEEKAFT